MKFRQPYLERFFLIILDVILIIAISFVINNGIDKYFILYISIFWILSSFYTKFYEVFRYTNWGKLISQNLSHYFIFSLAYFSYFGFVAVDEPRNNDYIKTLIVILSLITLVKIIIFLIQKHYRSEGKNPKNIVLFGNENSASILENLFQSRTDLGYNLHGFFSDNEQKSSKFLGSLKKGLNYIEKNKIDEIYCDPNELSSNKVSKIRKFALENEIDLLFIPETNPIYSKDLVLENFGTVSILKPKALPFEKLETYIIKRTFDILFSLIVIVTVLSWLLPILWIVIKLDSKGPLFFKQLRDGRNGEQFYCYKLRSMAVNADADKVSASKNDKRITRVGAFLRKTSLDELPQFLNVFLGDMSVVGPRPHMNLQTKKYEKEVANYLLRHEVKPGITGLAQISGYRGEVIKKSDIQNRVRLDIFYIENWTFILDLKIIAKTFINVFLKEDKAY